jgi:mRNA (guanine-N7-)-methyltransferase
MSTAINQDLWERAEKYDAMAVKHATVTYHDRRAFDTASVRHLNNFVKACMIDTACRTLAKGPAVSGLRVADIASGRGQDHSKWMYGSRAAGTRVSAYYGLDLGLADTRASELMASRYLEPATTHVKIEMGDMGVVPWGCDTVDVVTCQLALHYICDEETHVRHFFAEAARVLAPGGLLLLSFADGRSIVRRARNSGGKVAARFYTLDVPAEVYALRLASPYGNKYVFTLPGSVEGVPECLCHEGSVLKVAAAHGFLLGGVSMYFDELALKFQSSPRFAQIAEKMGGNGMGGEDTADALDTANLYRFVVLAKQADVLETFRKLLRT